MTVDPDESRHDEEQHDEDQHRGPVIRDKRRIDPETGQVREQAASTPAPTHRAGPTSGGPAAGAGIEAQLAERTADLQRLQAEYLNYKRRVERERENARKGAVAATVAALLPALDDIARAREHGELTGGFKAVADSVEQALAKVGLTAFGEPGDEFDPRIHEALMHSYSDEVLGPVCQVILQVGYRLDDRVIRPARVAVAEPPPPAEPVDQEPAAVTDDVEPVGNAADAEPLEGSDGGE